MTGAPWWADPTDPRRASRRTWTWRGALTAAVVLAVLGAAAATAATGPHIGETTTTPTGHLERPSVQALAAGCGPTQHITDPTSRTGWVDYDDELAYAPEVPVSGWFAKDRARRGDLQARPEAVLHGMWFGDRAIWVSADHDTGQLEALRTLAAANPHWRATVRVWPTERRDQMPAGTYAAAGWGAVQYCTDVDDRVLDSFFTALPPAPGADGTPPPGAARR